MQPNALTTFQQLNSAILSGVPFPGRTVGEAIDFLKAKAGEVMPEGFSYDFQGESRQYVQEGSRLVGDVRVRAHHHLPGAGGAV